MGHLVADGRLTDLACWLVIIIGAAVGFAVAWRIPDDDVIEVLREAKQITKDAVSKN